MNERERTTQLARTAMALYLTLATQPKTEEEGKELLQEWSKVSLKELVKTISYNKRKGAYKHHSFEWLMDICIQEAMKKP